MQTQRAIRATVRRRLGNAAGISVALAVLLGVMVAGCQRTTLARGEAQARANGPITIAAVWPWESRLTLLYGQGLQLALDEVNSAGGVLGRPLAVLREDDYESVDRGRLVAQRLAQNYDVVAVVGHMQSYVSLPAAAIYDLSGLLHLAPTATDPQLTQQGYRRLFRITFTDREIGAQMADVAAARSYHRLAIYYIRNAYGRSLANAFEERAIERGLVVADRQSYDPNTTTGNRALEDLLAAWRDLALDAIFVAGEPRQAATMIREARALGIEAAMLGGDALGTGGFIDRGGEAVEGTVIATAFHPDDQRAEVQRFRLAFRQEHGLDPDVSAALAYDAVRLIAHGIEKAKSTEPERVADALRAARDWPAVTGRVTFTDAGDLVDRSLGTMVVRDSAFDWLGGTPNGRAKDE